MHSLMPQRGREKRHPAQPSDILGDTFLASINNKLIPHLNSKEKKNYNYYIVDFNTYIFYYLYIYICYII